MTTPSDEPRQHQQKYFSVPEDTVYLILGILRLEKDGVRNPISNIETALKELRGCASHSANTGAQNKAEGVAQISSYNYIKDIAATKGMSFYDLVDSIVDDLKAQARIDAVVKELEAQIHTLELDFHDVEARGMRKAIALLKEGVGK